MDPPAKSSCPPSEPGHVAPMTRFPTGDRSCSRSHPGFIPINQKPSPKAHFLSSVACQSPAEGSKDPARAGGLFLRCKTLPGWRDRPLVSPGVAAVLGHPACAMAFLGDLGHAWRDATSLSSAVGWLGRPMCCRTRIPPGCAAGPAGITRGVSSPGGGSLLCRSSRGHHTGALGSRRCSLCVLYQCRHATVPVPLQTPPSLSLYVHLPPGPRGRSGGRSPVAPSLPDEPRSAAQTRPQTLLFTSF